MEPHSPAATTAQKNEIPEDAQKIVAQKPRPHVRSGKSLDQIYAALVSGVKKYFQQNHFKRAVIGLSGGLDSALTLKIGIDALGAENITALIMPELGLTKQENIEHAKLLCEFLGVRYYVLPINNFLQDYAIAPWKPNKLAMMNSKARIRAVLLYNFSNTENCLVLGTSNKSEILLGYGTKYGDLAADIEVIGDLLKTDAVKIADHIGLPPEIVHKVPSAELSVDQTDEEDMGASYNDLDKVLAKMELGAEECVRRGLPIQLVQLVFRRFEENKHKSEMPPVIKL